MIRTQLFYFLKYLWAILPFFLDYLVVLIPAKKPRRKINILFVRLDNIGDFVLWLEAAKEFRELYPQDKYAITLVGNSSWAGLSDHTGYFDKIIPINRNRFHWNVFY
ncbi:glycosyltransferase family 9 protein, partial [Candidatus Margulisiibacteriota bacterium]